MAYTKTTWAADTYLSARNLNHLETQHQIAADLVSTHTHDDIYYTQTLANVTFFHSYPPEFMGSGSGFDADMLDGIHVADLLGLALPQKAIMAWSGTDGDVPSGWAICNGQTVGVITTPDLRDCFVVGAGGSLVYDEIGGVSLVTPTASPNVASFVLTSDHLPPHQHGWSDYYHYTYGVCCTSAAYGYKALGHTTANYSTGSAGGGGGHGHEGGSITLNEQNNLPPYYALYFIEKVV